MERLLVDHLSHWLGGWPAVSELDVIGADERDRPGWDGKIHPAIYRELRGEQSAQPRVLGRVQPDQLPGAHPGQLIGV
ncbi:hypothetical protein [Nonomuraea sp. NPDC005650]|uniref:hypothetical protein n=1 Tax=Nonomuraea sp. NPDC005650 TaxID=3157045 RepID=UPI0033AF907A